jgi:heme-degrading monooxygenase HmoA
MAIVVRFEAPGATVEDYERVNASIGISGDEDAPDGLIQHIAAKADGGIVVVDVWESEEKLNTFFEQRAGRALAENGVQAGPPSVYKLHNMLKGSGTQPNVLMEVRVDRGPEVYDELVTRMPTHAGDGSGHPVYSHVAAVTENGGIYVVDLWESPEAFGRFAQEELGPAAGDLLGEIQPTFTPVHNTIRGRSTVPA